MRLLVDTSLLGRLANTDDLSHASATSDIYPAWKSLADASAAIGKQVHDVRLVAICQVHKLDGILTFNARHFLRLVTFAPGLSVVTPSHVINPHP